MFSTSHRPVPSTAALRVLRQLAYISSGTVCGAAALVTEERRRQTHVARKIIENSRTIKQHPRYAHSATVRKPDTSFYSAAELDANDSEALNAKPDGSRGRVVEGRHEDVHSPAVDIRPAPDDAFRSHELPSEVDKSYTKFSRKRVVPEQTVTYGAHITRGDNTRDASCQGPQRPDTYQLSRPYGRKVLPIQGRSDTHHRLCKSASPKASNGPSRYPDDAPERAPKRTRTAPVMLHSLRNEPAATVEKRFNRHHQRGDLARGVKLLCHIGEHHPAFETCLQKMVKKCMDNEKDELLLGLHRRFTRHDVFRAVIFPKLCAAYSKLDSKRAAHFITRAVANPIDNELVLNACQPAWAELVQKTWNITRNLDLTRALFDKMLHMASPHSIDASLFNAMIYVSVCAGETSQAEMLLQEMQTMGLTQPDVVTIGHFIHAAATTQDWNAVQRLFDMLGGPEFADAPSVLHVRLFNDVLSRYVQEHEPDDVWSFVSTALANKGIVPNEKTTAVVLESFIRGERLDLMKQWFRYLQRCGYGNRLDAHAAAIMVRKYYYERRPSHILLMLLSRNLTMGCPGLRSPELIALVKESIGYDMRNLRGPHAPRRLEAARLRLGFVEHTPSHVPNPLEWRDNATLRRKLDFIIAANPRRPEIEGTSTTGEVYTSSASVAPADLPLRDVKGVPSLLSEPLAETSQAMPDALEDLSLRDVETAPSHSLELLVEASRTMSLHSDGAVQAYDVREDVPVGDVKAAPPSSQGALHSPVHQPKDAEASLHTTDMARPTDVQPFPDEHLLPDKHPLPDKHAMSLGETPRDKSEVHHKMLLALSLNQPFDAVAFYRSSLPASGIPLSVASLEIAITASLRAHNGDPTEAEELLRTAQEAGLDVNAALTPLLIRRMTVTERRDLDPDELKKGVLDFYQTMHDKGVPLRHHVATAAAHALVQCSKFPAAIALLQSIYDSKWNKASRHGLDIAAMTVLLQCYVKLNHAPGISWTVTAVLDDRVRIDVAFMRVLRKARTHAIYGLHHTGKDSFRQLWELNGHWLEKCRIRRKAQANAATAFGNKLIRVILKCVPYRALHGSRKKPHRGVRRIRLFPHH